MWNPWDHSEHKESNVKTIQNSPHTQHRSPKDVPLFSSCINRDIVVFTPLNYIQTLKIQIFSGMSDMHFYSIYKYWKKPLNWVLHSRLGKIKNATTLKKSHRKKSKKLLCSSLSSYKKVENLSYKFLCYNKDNYNSCQIHVECIKKTPNHST